MTRRRVKKLPKPNELVTMLTRFETDNNEIEILSDYLSVIVSSYFSREALRGYCKQHDISYSLRTSKNILARKTCLELLYNYDYQTLLYTLEYSKEHWLQKIEDNDRHRPGYYSEMFDRCVDGLNKIIEYMNEEDGDTVCQSQLKNS